ncbi:hypothetical protein B7486_03765 [cyanobacterium TDX16]|nr:hypothetical protein B7486_03765 [cyanobacterium TDX16]
MNQDDQICYCYHVPLRKLVAFARREKPQRASQMSNCLGAGTGCGWCIPVLKRIQQQALASDADSVAKDAPALPESAGDYASARREYLRSPTKNTFEA